MAEKGGCQAQGLNSPPATLGTSSPTQGPSQQRMELGATEEGQPSQLGALPTDESSAHPFPWLCTLLLTSRLDSPMGGFPRAPSSHHALSLGHMTQASPGMGSPAQQGLPWLVPCPGQYPSVCLRCEDEKSIFLLADPLHELVDSTDGAGLGPQGTIAYVELKGAGYLGKETGYLLGTCLCSAWGWHCTFPMGCGAWAQGLQCRDMRWQWGTLNEWHLVCRK